MFWKLRLNWPIVRSNLEVRCSFFDSHDLNVLRTPWSAIPEISVCNDDGEFCQYYGVIHILDDCICVTKIRLINIEWEENGQLCWSCIDVGWKISSEPNYQIGVYIGSTLRFPARIRTWVDVKSNYIAQIAQVLKGDQSEVLKPFTLSQ